MDMISIYKNLVSNLERQELESSIHGSASPQIYGQLLAIYLLMNDLSNAKLLWKRIPNRIKEENNEIKAVWSVGVKLFLRDLPSVYGLVDNVEWPSHLKNIMNCIKDSTRERMLNLICKAYTSIRIQDVASFLGLDKNETIEKVKSLGWTLNDNNEYVTPIKPATTPDESSPVSYDDMMSRLTEYVAFLEN